MEIEKILFNGKDDELKEKLEQLPHTFFNLNTMNVDVSRNEEFIELQFQQRSKDFQIEISIPPPAQDEKITSYNGTTFTEFYYKKTHYRLRY